MNLSSLTINGKVCKVRIKGRDSTGRFNKVQVIEGESTVLSEHSVPALWLEAGPKGSVFVGGNRYAAA